MFGIGRLKERVEYLERQLERLPREINTEIERLQGELRDIDKLRRAMSEFIRKCDQCGQYKRISAKGWRTRGSAANSLMWWDGVDMRIVSGEQRVCPDCMAALKPVDAPEVVFRGDTPTCCVSLQGASKPEKHKGGK